MTTPTLRLPVSAERLTAPESDISQGARAARALAEIVHEMNQSPELDRVFALIARHAATLLGAGGSRVGMIENGEYTIVSAFGEAHAAAGTRLPLDDAFCAEAVRTARPTRYRGSAARAGAPSPDRRPRNIVAAPLIVGQRAIGAIAVLDDDAREFTEHDERILLALANHAAVAIEHARLLRASVRTLRHASILAASARSLALNVVPATMYADIWRIAHQSLGVDGVSIYLVDPLSRVTALAYVAGIGADYIEELVPTFWETLLGRVILTGVPDFRRDLRELTDRPIAQHLVERGVHSFAIMPLVVEGKPRGILSLRYREPQRFEPEQRQLLADFSSHAAVAQRNAVLLEHTEQRAARLAAVAKVQQAISAALSLPEVYAEVYRAVASVVDAPCFTLTRFDRETHEFVPEYAVDDGIPIDCSALPRFPLSDGATSQAYRLRVPGVASRTGRGWDGPALELGRAQRLAVVLSAPIIHGERVLGVLQALSYRHDAYDSGDVDLVVLIASQAGTAIANAMLFEAERHEREEAEAAVAIARVALAAATVDEAAAELLRLLDAVAPGGALALAVEQPGEAGLRVAAARGPAAALAYTCWPDRSEFPGAGHWDAVLPLTARDHAVGVLAIRIEPVAATNGASAGVRSLTAIARLLPSLALALHTIQLREEERRVVDQMRQQEKLAALGELVAGVAHEVNNPLAGISAFAQLLQEDDLTTEQHEAVAMIKREADRAVAVIRDLLTFARKSGPRAVPIDLNALLAQTLRLRQYGLRTAGVIVSLDLAPTLQPLHGDDRQLQQVLLNLIVNAEHAMTSTSRRDLRLRTRNDGSRVVLEVSDTGAGMSAELQTRIFEPFFTTKGEGKGTGLGLSVSYGIIHTHGGSLTVESAPGVGTTFRISLPAAPYGRGDPNLAAE